MKNPQTTIAPTFLMHIISAIGGVVYNASRKAMAEVIQLLEY